jgi:hypothetical protein
MQAGKTYEILYKHYPTVYRLMIAIVDEICDIPPAGGQLIYLRDEIDKTAVGRKRILHSLDILEFREV